MLRLAAAAVALLGTPALAQTPQFAAPVRNPFGLQTVGLAVRSTPAVADLDGDGDADVLTGDFGGDVFYFENTAGPDATSAYSAPVLLPFGYASPGLPQRLGARHGRPRRRR